MKVCLLSPTLPGSDPADAVGRHARALGARGGVSLTIAVTGEQPRSGATVGDALAEAPFDVALATHWMSTAWLHTLPAARHAFWVDAVAHHRIGIWNAERIAARLAYDLPVDFLAANDTVAADLADLRPDARCLIARSGIDKAVFAPAPQGGSDGGGPLRVVAVVPADEDPPAEQRLGVNVRQIAPHADAATRAYALRAADVVLISGSNDQAALEAMHCGATCIVLAGGPAEHIVVHGENGLVAEPDDLLGVARWLEHLDRDRPWLGALRAEATMTAGRWPSWDEAAAELAGGLHRLVAEPAPDADGWPARLMAGALASVSVHRNDDVLLAAELERVQSDEAYLVATALRERVMTSTRLGGLRRVARPALRAAKRRLG